MNYNKYIEITWGCTSLKLFEGGSTTSINKAKLKYLIQITKWKLKETVLPPLHTWPIQPC